MNLQIFSRISRIACVLLCVLLCGSANAQGFSNAPAPKREFRGAWIATVSNIDWPSKQGLPAETQKAELIARLDKLRALGCNAIIFQVRPVADAFYESALEPWSRFLTGKAGQHPGYDPLAFACIEAHKRGMEVHAWFNPFRALTDSKKNPNPPGHVTRTHPEWVIHYGGKGYLDPGRPEARAYSVGVITDCARRYDIDAVHLDDYFYPYKVPGQEFGDAKSFATHGGGFANKADWRRGNVNKFVQALDDSLRRIKPSLKFGISPFGVWRNSAADPERGSATRATQNYDDLYADVLLWMEKGWIDYCMPQLYWERSHKLASFDVLMPWWQRYCFQRHIYYGLGLYRMTGAPTGAWVGTGELMAQIRSIRASCNNAGYALYSASSFDKIAAPIQDSLRRQAANIALPPTMPWLDNVPPGAPQNLDADRRGQGTILKWRAPNASAGESLWYAIYRFAKGVTPDPKNLPAPVAVTQERSWVDVTPCPDCRYGVTALDRTWNESVPATDAVGWLK
jgi:uncharacterized lipoprotein YddW (UPF0748 family)